MRTQAIVMPAAQFDAWARRQGRAVGGENGGEAAGAAVFTENGCGGCHALAKANASGESGPSLEDLPASAEEAGTPLEEYVRESIVDPDAYIHPGYNANVMPKTYSQLPAEQIDALVQYLVGGQTGT
jgi:cytochrome c oxidase subunit 2